MTDKPDSASGAAVTLTPKASKTPPAGATLTLLTRTQILAATTLATETVDVPEWGGAVTVRGMSGTERDAFEASFVKGQGKAQKVSMDNVRAKLVQKSIVNADGTPMFQTEDIVALGTLSAAALARVYDVAARLSGLTKDDVEELAGD